jgi:hypothetical protein
LADAFVEVTSALEDVDFDAHEIDGEIAAIDLGESNGVLLGGDDRGGLAFLASIDGVEDFLLGEAMVIGESFGVDQVATQPSESLFKALGLGDSAEGGDFDALDEVEAVAFAGEDILEVEGAMFALDDTGGGVLGGDPLAELGGIAVAFGDEDEMRATEVGGRFAEGAAREEVFVAERLLVIDEDDVAAAAGEFPVLVSVVEEEGVASEFFDGVAAAFDTVFVDEDDDVFEIGGEHVGFVACGFGVEEEGFPIGDHPGRGTVVTEEKFIEETFGEGWGFGAIAAREDGDGAAFVLENTGKFFHHGGFSGAADGEISDGDDLDAEGGIAEKAPVVEETAEFDEASEDER